MKQAKNIPPVVSVDTSGTLSSGSAGTPKKIQPLFYAWMDVDHLVRNQCEKFSEQYNSMLDEAGRLLVRYMTDNMFITPVLTPRPARLDRLRQLIATSTDDITMILLEDDSPGQEPWHGMEAPAPAKFTVTLYSFKTPVTELEAQLNQVIAQACKTV